MSTADYLLKKYGVEAKGGKKGDNTSTAGRKKIKKIRRDEGNQIGGMRIVDQDDQDWMKAGNQDQGDQNESEIYKLMRKEYQRTQQGIEQEETEELEEEAPQVVDTQFKSRENSGWETIDLNASKQKKSATSNMEVDDSSPPRRARHDSPDASPPRRTRHDSPSPPRRTRHDSPDASPPRRTRHDSPSPPRRPAASGDASPPRRPKMASSNEDASPPRRQVSRSPSPPRRAVGANAETIYRDKSGKKIDVKLEKLKAEMEKKKKDEEAEKHMVWGKGLVQQRQQEDRLKNLKEIAAMPFATYKGDLAKDESMKNVERWGDPMAGLVSKKEAKETRPKYRGPAPPPNRFDIAPGFRWDGVDRSNGYEKKAFMRDNAREAMKEEAYQYSVSDM